MMNHIRSFLVDLKPSNITGGAPFYPLFVLFGLNAVDELDRTAFGVLIPEIRDHFSLDIQGVLTLVSVVGAVTLVLSVPIAFFADRWSRVRMATAGASVWSLFSVLTGLAPNVGTLGVARAGSGLGKAVNDPTHNSLISDYYDVSVRVKVFGFHRAANSVGQIIGPLLAGLLAYFFTWRTPFIVFAVPTLVFVVLALRLRDPVRGAPERRAMGADASIVDTAEEPPTWAEAWRISWQVRSLRRIWFSLPFLAVSLIGLISLLSLYYEEVFGLNEVQRGTIQAIAEPGQIVGLAVGIPFAFRMAARGPGFLVKLLALAGVVQAGLFVVLILAPNLVFAVTTNILLSAVGAVLVPGIYATLSLTIPPRARATGFSLGVLFALPGLIILVIIGGIADSAGLRPAMIVLVPVYLIGAFILASAGRFIAGDIDRIRTSTLARSQAMVGRREGKVKLLLVKDLDVSYDGVQVLFGVDMQIDEGEIVALLGTNGAGKSTLLRAISGLLEPDRGVVVFDGRDTTNMPPNDLVSRGIVQVPGGRGVFPSLTVDENLKIAGWLYRSDESYVKEAIARVHEYFPVLAERAGEQAGSLSGGEQQMLTLGQAFIARPKLLMIDELSLGLAPIVVSKLLDIVEAIREQGTTIILVEQSVNIALTVAQTAYFMEKGEIRFHGPTKELLSRPEILRSVFLKGSAAADLDGKGKRPRRRSVRVRRPVGERSVLEVEGLSKRFGGITAVDDVSLRLREHQILGVIGPNGAGKTSLFDLISGFLVPDAGSICLNDRDITSIGTDVRSRLGLGRSFQDARLFPGLTVREAIAVALDRRVVIKDPIAEALSLPSAMRSRKEVGQRVEEIIEATNLHAFSDKFISELSTGSRRIVEIACSLAHDPDVLLLDEPSSGIAQREVEELAGVLADLPSRVGASLLVIEHDMPLITKIADEMVAMDLGRVIAHGKPAAVVKDPEVVTSYLGGREQVIKRSGALSAKRRPRVSQKVKR